MSPYWPGRISVEIYGIARHGTKILGCQQTGIEFVPELRREGKGAHNLTSSERGMTMHTTTIAKITAKMSSTHWFERLSASLASFLAVAQPQWGLCFASRHQSKALYAGCARSQLVHPSAM